MFLYNSLWKPSDSKSWKSEHELYVCVFLNVLVVVEGPGGLAKFGPGFTLLGYSRKHGTTLGGQKPIDLSLASSVLDDSSNHAIPVPPLP